MTRAILLNLCLALALAITLPTAGCVGPTGVGATVTTGRPGSRASMTFFYDSLRPYGKWIYLDNLGWAWAPSPSAVEVGFFPYVSGGYWTYSSAGWFFASRYPWGWATFHYGYWYFDPAWGWIWIPDTVWAPSWVDWRIADSYVGWAPLPPPIVRDRRAHWVFVASAQFTARDLPARLLPRERARIALQRTTPARRPSASGLYYRGPRVERVEKISGRPVRRIQVTPPRRGTVSRVVVRDGRVRSESVRPSRSTPPRRAPQPRPTRRAEPPRRSHPAPVQPPVRREHRRR